MGSDSDLVVRPVRSQGDWRAFQAVRDAIYRRDRYAVRPLDRQAGLALDVTRNPFYQHAERELFVAWRGTLPIGRIAAIDDRLYREYHGDGLGFFGFFEAPNHVAVACELVAAVEHWLAARGCRRLGGPVNPSLKGEFGVLVSGHDFPPYVQMSHTPSYYDALLQFAGFSPMKSFHAFRISGEVRLRRQLAENVAPITAGVMRRHPELRARSSAADCLGADLHRINALANRVRSEGVGIRPAHRGRARSPDHATSRRA